MTVRGGVLIGASGNTDLSAYAAPLAISWLARTPELGWREVDGTLAFADISGFTRLTEALALRGRVGAEQLSDVLDSTFTALLHIADDGGGELIKWGGDALLLLFSGSGHELRACATVCRMRDQLGRTPAIPTGRGRVRLSMSAGIHSGSFFFALVGDPEAHRELLVSGPAASRVARLEAIAEAGEVALSRQTAAMLPADVLGPTRGEAILLAGEPRAQAAPPQPGDAVSPGLAGGDLSILIPPAIRASLLRSGVQEPGRPADGAAKLTIRRTRMEHRQIAVAFVQFSGTDRLYADQGPAVLAAALEECVQVVQRATAAHGVTFFESDINVDGGKIMLTAGAPVASEDDEARMLRTARWIVEHAGTLPVRVGVNRGPVFSGDFGPAFRRTYSVKGDAVNLAARVMGKAAPGQVLATAAVLKSSKTRFELEPLAPFAVKGKSNLIDAAVVGAMHGSALRTGSVKLFGREEELDCLTQACERAKAGSGQILDIVGAPGIGKAALAAAGRAYAEEAGLAVHAVNCEAYETATPYWPLRALIRSVLSLPVSAHDALVAGELASAVASSAPTLAPWLPLLGIAAGVELTPTPEVEQLDFRFRSARLAETVVAFLEALLTGPALLFVGDAHLIDHASLDLLAVLARQVEEHPWVLVTTRRDTGSGYLPGTDIPPTTLKLAPLDAAAATALARSLLSDIAMTPGDVNALVARTGGNPLFLRSMLAAVTDGATVGSLPETVEAVIGSRIDRLEPATRMLLRVGAVLGTEFSGDQFDSLVDAAGLPGSHTELQDLPELIDAGSDGRYAFVSQLGRDTAYEGLPYGVRRLLHGTAGELIEATAEDLVEVAALLSLHYFHAGRADKAFTYSRLAGEAATATGAYFEADQLLARALEAARSLRTVADQDLSALGKSLGIARTRIGRQEQALRAFRAARRRARQDPLEAAALLGWEAEALLRLGRHANVLASVRRGLRLLEGIEESARAAGIRARLEGLYSAVREAQGRYRQAFVWARGAEIHARQSADPAGLAAALESLHRVTAMLSLTPEQPYGQMALDLYTEVGDRIGQSRALNNLAVAAWSQGSGTQALAMFERAEVLASVAGDSTGAGAARYNIGDVMVQMGRLVEAEALLRDLMPQLRGLGIADFRASALRALGLAVSLSGGHAEGRELLNQARQALAEMGEDAEVVETDAAIAAVLLEQGLHDQASALADAAAERAGRDGAGHLLPRLLRIKGAALAELGRDEQAAEALARALDLAARHSGAELGFILGEQARLALRTGLPETAEALAGRARVALDELGYTGGGRYSVAALSRSCAGPERIGPAS